MQTYLMEGGVPAGTRMRPEDEGCRMMRMSINNTTMLGNSRMKPSGIEIEELPFNRIRLRKKDNLEADFGDFSSSEEAGVVYGMLLTSRWTKPELFEYFSLMAIDCGEISLRGFRVYQQVVMSPIGDFAAVCSGFRVCDKTRTLAMVE